MPSSYDLPDDILCLAPVTHTERVRDGKIIFAFEGEGKFDIHHTGRMRRIAAARFEISRETSDGQWEITEDEQQLELTIFTPTREVFTADTIAIEHLHMYRDLRGQAIGEWSYKVSGRIEIRNPGIQGREVIVNNMEGYVRMSLAETLESQSALPLIPRGPIPDGGLITSFDLFRVGRFEAQIHAPLLGWRGTLRLKDPNGSVVKTTTSALLTFPVSLATLDKSRDPAGRVRNWTLEAIPASNSPGPVHMSATVIGEAKIASSTLLNRVETLLGRDGNNVEIKGENRAGKARAIIKLKSVVQAETIDMLGIFDGLLGIDKKEEIKIDHYYTLAETDEAYPYTVDIPLVNSAHDPVVDLKLKLGTLKVGRIDVGIGGMRSFPDNVPGLTLDVAVEGEIRIVKGSYTLVTVKPRDGRFRAEIGLTLDENAMPKLTAWVPGDMLDVNVRAETWLEAGIFTGLLGAAAVKAISHTIERSINEKLSEGVKNLFNSLSIARIVWMMLGAHFDHLPPRMENGDIVFDYVAPIEPEPKPRIGYSGVIGRRIVDTALAGQTRFEPRSLPDTWAAGNLQHIEHIVVVMMENRSYDHVLGYRASAAPGRPADGADGLTAELIDSIQRSGPPGMYAVRPLAQAGFDPNHFNMMTRLPKHVGHELEHVATQLSVKTRTTDGTQINGPLGFVKDFTEHYLGPEGEDREGVVPNDVLGYYTDNDLPFFAHLAQNYAYCDRYFCSHPGATLPNRMYSLAGDLQYDRTAKPILHNNSGDNFLLSRAPTIYDLLARKSISWRVYESQPSVTMLRMFARYVGDNEKIVPIERLAADVARGDLPSFVAIEPQMHAHPQDDDHPDADMYRGQFFLQEKVYRTLRSNPDLWRKTLLIITYDEHGGLYDHVVPPLADVLKKPIENASDARGVHMNRATSGDFPWGNVIVHGNMPSPQVEMRIPYGVRVPTFVVSPWVKPGKGPSIVLDHCSIIKTVLARFLGSEKPFLSDRVAASQSFDSYLTTPEARMDIPMPAALRRLPDDVRREMHGASRIETPALFRRQMREGPVDYHHLTGRLARLLGR